MVRDAVAASVTYPAPSRCSSQVSVVVTVPSAVRFSRSQVIFGAAKYGSSGRPVIAASSAARSASRAQTPPDRRSCQTIAGDSGLPVLAVPGQHGLALVGQRDRVRGRSGGRQRLAARREDRIEQLFRVGLHPVRAHAAGADGDLAAAEHLGARPDEQRLGRRRALVDGQDIHP